MLSNIIAKFQSTEFLLSLGSAVAAWLVAAAGYLPSEYAALLMGVSAVVYALSRGLAKFNMDLKSGWKTSEFWLAMAGIIVTVLVAIPGVIDPQIALAIGASIGASYVVSRGLSKNPLDESGVFEEMLDPIDVPDVVDALDPDII